MKKKIAYLPKGGVEEVCRSTSLLSQLLLAFVHHGEYARRVC
jgi:hypothetical protein